MAIDIEPDDPKPALPPRPDRAPTDDGGDEAPETPPTEPKPAPIKEPPDSPQKRRGPYVVGSATSS